MAKKVSKPKATLKTASKPTNNFNPMMPMQPKPFKKGK